MTNLTKCTLFLSFFLCSTVVLAQKTISISVIDSASNVQLANASISFVPDLTPKVENKYFTDKTGKVDIKIPESGGTISASFIGYKKKIIKIGPNDPSKYYIINLELEVNALKEVVISEKTATLTATPEGYNYNIDKNTKDLNVNAFQLLKKLPGVFPEQNGQLKLMGMPVTIFIDSKPTLLSGKELDQYLQSLSLNDVKNFKVQTNPSAAYGSSGAIIDIITTTSLLDGISIRTDARLETHDKYGGGLNVDYKEKRYTGKYNLNYGHSNSYSKNFYEQENYTINEPLSKYLYNSNSDENPNSNVNLSLNNNFAIDKNNTIGFLIKYNNFKTISSFSNSTLKIFNQDDDLNQIQHLYRNDLSNSSIYYADLNYRAILNKKGTNLTLDTYYWKRNANNGFTTGQRYLNNQNIITNKDSLENNSDQDLSIKSVSANFTHPFHKYITLTSGIVLTNFFIDGSFSNNFYNYITNSLYNDPNNTYSLDYTENVYSAFVNFSGKYKRLTYSVGFRGEGTSLGLNVIRSLERTHNNSDFFTPLPNIGFVYGINNISNLTLAYSRKIWRVSYSQLNPINFSSDPATIRRGNPDLKPSENDTYTISYDLNAGKKGFYVATFSYAQENNPYSWINLKDDVTGQYINQPFNYKSNSRLNLNVYTQHNLNKTFGVTLNLKASRTFMDMQIFNIPNPKPINSYGGTFSANAKVGKNAAIELFAVAQSKFITPQGKQGDYHYIDIAFSKRFMKDALGLNITMSDIFNTNRYNYENDTDFFRNSGYRKTESRVLRLSMSYKFGKTKENSIKDYTPKEDNRFGQ